MLFFFNTIIFVFTGSFCLNWYLFFYNFCKQKYYFNSIKRTYNFSYFMLVVFIILLVSCSKLSHLFIFKKKFLVLFFYYTSIFLHLLFIYVAIVIFFYFIFKEYIHDNIF